MEFDFIETVTVAIERAQLWSEFVGIEAEPDGVRPAERSAQRA